VTVCQDAQEKATILYKGNQIIYTIFQKQEHQSEIVTAKQVEHSHQPFHPAPDRPWRTGFAAK
jgi:hypothetical protein